VPQGYAEVAFRQIQSGDNEEMLCTIGLAVDQLEAMSQAGAEAIANAWSNTIRTVQTTELAFRGCYVNMGPDGLGMRYVVDRNVAGGVNMPPCVQNTAVLLKKSTALGGRRNRGRMYVPGIPEGKVFGNGQMVGVDHAAWNTQAINLRAELAALSFVGECVIFHTTVAGAEGIAPTAIVSMSADTRVATQRRRLR
jgi:hypothetical protein